MSNSATLWPAAGQASLSFTISRSLLKLISIELVMPSNHVILFKTMKAKVSWSCPTLCNPMGYTVHGILQARILEWVAIPFSRGSSQPRNPTGVSCITGGFFTSLATREAHFKQRNQLANIWAAEFLQQVDGCQVPSEGWGNSSLALCSL